MVDVAPSVLEAPLSVPPVSCVFEVAAGVSAAEASSVIQSGTYAAGTSASTLTAEPEIEIPAPTSETPHLNPLPQGERKEELASVAFAVAPETAAVSAPPPVVEVAPSVSEVAAGVSQAAEVAGEDQPGTNAAGTSASTLTAEPEMESPVPTPETPHLNPLPQGERKEELASVAFAVAPETAEPMASKLESVPAIRG